MNISQGFITEVVTTFHKELEGREDLCKIAKSEHNLEFYKKHAYQELYALRYLPAYYFEYCVLAHELYERIHGSYANIQIASFGCGLSPDYYAFVHNLKGIDFRYFGYDAVEWSSRRHMPQVDGNHHFIFKAVQNIVPEELHEIDVFMFPKSMGDIRNSGTGVLKGLATKIASTSKQRIFFLNSFVTREFDDPLDKKHFREIHEQLISAGFSTDDDINVSYYTHDGHTKNRPIGLRAIDKNFLYPNNKIISCECRGSEGLVCNDCMVAKNPIFTNQYMSFQIVEYARV